MKPALLIAMTCTWALALARGDDQLTSTNMVTVQKTDLPAPVPLDSESVLESAEPQDRGTVVEDEFPNEIVLEKLTLKGAAIQWFKTDNLLQLFNPFAPARYGNGDQNLSYDIITDKPKGITIIAIEWGGARTR
jgi:hypothetical protein